MEKSYKSGNCPECGHEKDISGYLTYSHHACEECGQKWYITDSGDTKLVTRDYEHHRFKVYILYDPVENLYKLSANANPESSRQNAAEGSGNPVQLLATGLLRTYQKPWEWYQDKRIKHPKNFRGHHGWMEPNHTIFDAIEGLNQDEEYYSVGWWQLHHEELGIA